MATTQSDLITKIEAAKVRISDGAYYGDDAAGVKLCATAIVTLDGDEAAAGTIKLCDVPEGMTVIPQECTVFCSDPGTALVIDVGYASNDDAIADGLDVSAGGLFNLAGDSGTAPADALTPVRFTEQTRLFATVKTATTLNANAKLVFIISFRAIA